MAVVAIHDVRDLAFAVQALTRADELETGARRIGGQVHSPAETGGHRALDRRNPLALAEQTVHGEAFHVIGRQFGREHAGRLVGRLVHERAAHDEHQRGGQRVRRDAARQGGRRRDGARRGVASRREPRDFPAPGVQRVGRCGLAQGRHLLADERVNLALGNHARVARRTGAQMLLDGAAVGIGKFAVDKRRHERVDLLTTGFRH
jgi:hypothetical protein